MEKQLFNKLLWLTDIHFGEKNNERLHNQDCSDFIDWAIDRAKSEKVDCILFGGDWFHHRHQIHVGTLNYSKKNMKKLNDCGIPVVMLLGNHDLYYKDRRDVSSVEATSDFKNITIIDSITKIGDVLLVPWVLNSETDLVKKELKNCTYCFGHFELPAFLMNSLVTVPDKDHGLTYEDFNDVKEWAFSGHYHIRQNKGKMIYTGNTFPTSYSDVWDDDRGIMILNWGEYPTFEKFPNAPKYRTLNLSEILEDPGQYIDNLTYVKITPDIEINYEDQSIIEDVFRSNFKPRKINFLPSTLSNIEENSDDDSDKVESIEDIVINGLKTVESNVISKERLVEIWMRA